MKNAAPRMEDYRHRPFGEEIETAKKKKLEGIRFVAGDCENLPFAENSFDVVTCSMSFHHYPNPENFFTVCIGYSARAEGSFCGIWRPGAPS